jgi:hypothetical protein
MNTIVFVLMVYANGGNWIPTLEFSSQAKCETATTAIIKQTYINPIINRASYYKCVQIEK